MFRKYLLNKDIFIYFWLPRITCSILFFLVYKNIHLDIDVFNPSSKQFDYIPDYEKYLYTLKWNPLFSLSLQLIHRIFEKHRLGRYEIFNDLTEKDVKKIKQLLGNTIAVKIKLRGEK